MTRGRRRDSPPLARGAPDPFARQSNSEGLTPACAGSTCARPVRSRLARTHPRLRGEHCDHVIPNDDHADSPPLARGARRGAGFALAGQGLTPACAGSTRGHTTRAPGSWTHPRLRGEHTDDAEHVARGGDSPPLARGAPKPCSRAPNMIGLTPLARGARSCEHLNRHRRGLTPACAGSTCCARCGRPRVGTHPRLRGEHDW